MAACAKACFIALLENKFPEEVFVELAEDWIARFKIFDSRLRNKEASCVVIKNAGDDPDVTHAEEIGCKIRLVKSNQITFKAGNGVGTVTLPGLQVSVGEPAINPGPRKLINDQLTQLQAKYDAHVGIEVTSFVPRGEELSKQTFNPRIGIEGGISILGTTGVLRPFSSQAYVDSIRQYVNVAVHNHCKRLVLTPGKRSENFVKQVYANEPVQAYLHIGNFIGESLKIISKTTIKEVVLGLMLGKAIKLAEGNLDTHSSKVVFNNNFASQIAASLNYSESIIHAIRQAKLANELWDIMPVGKYEGYYKKLIQMATNYCNDHIGGDHVVKVILFTPTGQFLM